MIKKTLIITVFVFAAFSLILSGCGNEKGSKSQINSNSPPVSQNDEMIRNQIQFNNQVHQSGINALTQ